MRKGLTEMVASVTAGLTASVSVLQRLLYCCCSVQSFSGCMLLGLFALIVATCNESANARSDYVHIVVAIVLCTVFFTRRSHRPFAAVLI